MNLYAYTANDPVNATDPFGLETVRTEGPNGDLECTETDDTPEEITVTGERPRCDRACQNQKNTQRWLRQLRDQFNKSCKEELSPNGCGSGWNEPLVPEVPLGLFDFSKACEAHDNCFATEGADFDQCNAQFEADMLSAVSEAQGGAAPGGSVAAEAVGELGKKVVSVYSSAVQTSSARGAFDRAQQKAAECSGSGGKK